MHAQSPEGTKGAASLTLRSASMWKFIAGVGVVFVGAALGNYAAEKWMIKDNAEDVGFVMSANKWGADDLVAAGAVTLAVVLLHLGVKAVTKS